MMTSKLRWMPFGAGLAVALAFAAPAAPAAQPTGSTDGFIGGTTPDRRPEGAPVLTTYEKSDAWFAAALTGISKPYPDSLNFLKDQGGWFTPFTRPGMTAPYDIRGWHAKRDPVSQGH